MHSQTVYKIKFRSISEEAVTSCFTSILVSRIPEKVLVFNSFSDGSWGYEERAAVVFPFEKKRIYTVELFGSKTNENSVLVYVNGHFLYEFHQRESAATTTSVEVAGDIFIHSVHVT
ncbi:galactoside-binding lectin [Oesophagostomum dentatum]|uniref:Galectin n=1 Tax=Oesophagostomum dentatum TaxID=61180 RepID=A0A0B1S0Z3_OESDE|nr:galactoside-binding lectin [Oesophagostomum dentatum]